MNRIDTTNYPFTPLLGKSLILQSIITGCDGSSNKKTEALLHTKDKLVFKDFFRLINNDEECS